MKIVVIGPGAIGCLVAASLSRYSTRHKIWLLDHNPDRARYLTDHGLTLIEDNRTFSCPVRVSADADVVGQADAVILCVKSHAVESCLETLEFFSNQDCMIMTLQNGLGHLDLLRHALKKETLALGVTALGANLVSPGQVRSAGKGITKFGQLYSPTDEAAEVRLKKIAAALTGAGLETIVVSNILDHAWQKLFINAGINALTAIHDCPNGMLLDNETARARMQAAVLEAVAVARASGVTILGDPLERTIEVCRATGNNISSMLQDARNHRPTEIDAINGVIVNLAQKHQVPVPVNEELVSQVKKIEGGYLT